MTELSWLGWHLLQVALVFVALSLLSTPSDAFTVRPLTLDWTMDKLVRHCFAVDPAIWLPLVLYSHALAMLVFRVRNSLANDS